MFSVALSVFAVLALVVFPAALTSVSYHLSSFDWRFAFRNLGRSRLTSSLSFFAILIMGFLFGIGPTLVRSSLQELETPDKSKLPAYFLINIPEESVDRLNQFVKENDLTLKYVSPLILVRLEKVNGEPVNQDELKRFPTRVSYRDHLLESESIVEGSLLPGEYNPEQFAIPPVSVEVEYAGRRGFKIGDRLEFNIHGLPFEAQVHNFRRIEWNSFHPNFFLQFQDGVLNDVPKTFIGVIYNPPNKEVNAQLKFELSREFPELSMIDLGRTLKRVAEINNTNEHASTERQTRSSPRSTKVDAAQKADTNKRPD